MRYIIGCMSIDWQIQWQRSGDEDSNAVTVSFRGDWPLEEILKHNGEKWLWRQGNWWYLHLDAIRQRFESFNDLTWLKGVVRFEQKNTLSEQEPEPRRFTVYREGLLLEQAQRIFLSHKGANKPLVRDYYRILKELGFQPWLDEEDMPAGTELHRGVLEGFQQSCAAVFFITPQFKDENYLAIEVDHAVEEKRKKKDRFEIVTIVLAKGKETVKVPELLTRYVYKSPKSQLDALYEIVRALPIQVGPPSWRPGIATDSVPKVKRPRGVPIRFQSNDQFLHFMGKNASGGSITTTKDKAIRVEYGFQGRFFNSLPENIGLMNIKVVLLKGKTVLGEVIPRHHPPDLKVGQMLPLVTSLTLPSRRWLEVKFYGSESDVAKFADCDGLRLVATTVEGEKCEWRIEEEFDLTLPDDSENS